jgi:hypothetical protein
MIQIEALRKIPIVEEIQSDLLVTTYFQDLGSPKGPTGMIDWRLNGFISRNIVQKRITGAKGEITLVPLNQKFSTQRMILLGLGKWREYTIAELRSVLPALQKTVMDIKPERVCFCIPRALNETYEKETEDLIKVFFVTFPSRIQVDVKILNIV